MVEQKENKNIWYKIGYVIGAIGTWILGFMSYAILALFLTWLIKILWTHTF